MGPPPLLTPPGDANAAQDHAPPPPYGTAGGGARAPPAPHGPARGRAGEFRGAASTVPHRRQWGGGATAPSLAPPPLSMGGRRGGRRGGRPAAAAAVAMTRHSLQWLCRLMTTRAALPTPTGRGTGRRNTPTGPGTPPILDPGTVAEGSTGGGGAHSNVRTAVAARVAGVRRATCTRPQPKLGHININSKTQ